MPEMINLVGRKFNKLLVIEFAGRNSKGRPLWKCRCDCGNIAIIRGEELKRGQKYCSNCVPKGRPSHGLSHLPEFGVWAAMKQRCDNPKCDAYKDYGARGISYCNRWEKFENFYADMGLRPSKDHTLERKDNDGDYKPSNCKWATRVEQARNFKSNVILEFMGEKKCISEWAEIYGLKHDTIASRLENGWSIEDSITTKVRTPKLINFNGKQTPIAEVERVLGFSSNTIGCRLKRGYTEQEAIIIPSGVSKNQYYQTIYPTLKT